MMRKIIKKIFNRNNIRPAVKIILLAVLWNLALSSFAVCRIWLPFISFCTETGISADEADISPIAKIFGGNNLSFGNLKYRSKSIEAEIGRLDAHISYIRLLTGKLHAEKVDVSTTKIKLKNNYEPKKNLFNPERVRILSLNLKDTAIEKDSCRVIFAHANGLSVVQNGKTIFSPDGKIEAAGYASDFKGIIKYTLGNDLAPIKISGDFITKAEKWDLTAKTEFLLERVNNKNAIDIKKFSIKGVNTDISMNGSGSIIPGTCDFSFSASGEARLPSGTVPQFANGVFLKDTDVKCSLTLSGKAGNITTVSHLEIETPALEYDKKEFMRGFTLAADSEIRFEPELRVTEIMNAEITLSREKETFARFYSVKPFSFNVRDAALNVTRGTPECTLEIKDFPLAEINAVMPLNAEKGTLSGKYTVSADTKKEKLKGSIETTLANAGVLLAGERIMKEVSLSIKAGFESSGLRDIRSFTVSGFDARLTGNGRECAAGGLSGTYAIKDNSLNLAGNITAIPAHVLEIFESRACRELASRITKNGCAEHKTGLAVRLFWRPNTGEIKYTAKGRSESGGLLGMDFTQNKYELDMAGELLLTPEKQYFSISCGRLFSKDVITLLFDAEAAFPANRISADLTLEHLSPHALQSAFRQFDYDYRIIDRMINGFKGDSIGGVLSAVFDPVETILEITRFKLDFKPDAESAMHLTLDSPIKGNPYEMNFNKAKAVLAAEKMPVEHLNMFILDSSPFKFSGGRIDGTIDMDIDTVNRETNMRADLFGEGFKFNIFSTEHDCGVLTVNGAGAFKKGGYFTLDNINARATKDGEVTADFNTSCSIALHSPYNSDFKFTLNEAGRALPAAILPMISEYAVLKSLDGSGTMELVSREHWDKNNIVCDFKIKDAVFSLADMQKKQSEKFNGSFTLRFNHGNNPYGFEIETSLRLEEAGNESNTIDITFKRTPDETTKYLLKSEKLDAELIAGILKGARQNAKLQMIANHARPDESEVHAKGTPSTSKWPIKTEPEPFEVDNRNAIFFFDLENIFWTDDLNASFSGSMPIKGGILSAKDLKGKLNGSPIKLDFTADLSKKDGFPFKAILDAENIDVAPLVKAFANEETRKKDIHGIITKICLEISGRGISANALDKDLAGTLELETKDLSVPLTDRESVSFLRIVMLPLEVMPRLIDILPQKQTREFLRRRMGNQVDILAGNKNVIFEQGLMRAILKGSDIIVEKMIVTGPGMKSRTEHSGRINLLHDQIKLDTMTEFAGVRCPLSISGELSSPSVDYTKFIIRFLPENAVETALGMFEMMTLGLTGNDDEWKIK